MIIDLAKVSFTNDMFSTILPSGDSLVLNSVNESFLADGEENEQAVKAINIEIITVEGGVITCPCVIGLGNDYMNIKSDYIEYEGVVLTPDNMVYCTMEIYE